jgi:hypothetical protein
MAARNRRNPEGMFWWGGDLAAVASALYAIEVAVVLG